MFFNKQYIHVLSDNEFEFFKKFMFSIMVKIKKNYCDFSTRKIYSIQFVQYYNEFL
jgi:hypothetical protein